MSCFVSPENTFSVSENAPNRSRSTFKDADFSPGGILFERFCEISDGVS